MPPALSSSGVGLILVAAGQGTRLGAGRPKALVTLGQGLHEAPIVVHALHAALACRALTSVVVVAPPDPEGMEQLTAAVRDALPALPVLPALPDRTREKAPRDAPEGPTEHAKRPHRTRQKAPLNTRGASIQVIPGGAERSDSVAAGLAALPPEVDVVLVHDAARALAPSEVFDRVVEAVRAGHQAVTPALPVTDTIKQVEVTADGTEIVASTIDRATLRAVQTPQGFRRSMLERAHAETHHAVTDDCGMVEALGEPVLVVPGHPRAMKITTPGDLEVAAAWLQGRPAPALIVLSGAPGVGKTSLARELCRRVGAAHVRVDTIEQGLIRGGMPAEQLGAQGYGAAHEVAADQLAVGLPVVADMVNGVVEARQAWEQVAARTGARLVRVLLECSHPDEHRRRVESRDADIEGHRLPDWDQARTSVVAPWPAADVRVDTAVESIDEAATRIEEALR